MDKITLGRYEGDPSEPMHLVETVARDVDDDGKLVEPVLLEAGQWAFQWLTRGTVLPTVGAWPVTVESPVTVDRIIRGR